MKRLFAGLGRNVIALAAVSFLTDIGSEMVFPLLPLFLTGTLRGSAVMLGAIEGSAAALSSVLRVASGWIADRTRRHKALVFFGYGLSVVARPVFALATLPWHVLAVRLADRFGKGVRIAPRDALIAGACAPEVRGKAFGFQKAMDHLGAAIGPAIAGLLLASGWRITSIFWLTAIPGVLVLLTIGIFVRDAEPVGDGRRPSLSLAPFGADFRRPLAIVGVFTLGASSDAFLILRAPQCGIPEAWVPIFWCGVNLSRMLLSVPGGVLSDRIGRGLVILIGWLAQVAALACLAFVESPVPFLALAAAQAVYFALGESVLRAHVADVVPRDLRASAFGLYYGVVGVASVPAGIGFGLVWQRGGPRAAFLAAAAVSLVATIAFARRVLGRGLHGPRLPGAKPLS